jgi:hypothetical protein
MALTPDMGNETYEGGSECSIEQLTRRRSPQEHTRTVIVGGEPSPVGEGYLKRPLLVEGGPKSTLLPYARKCFAGGRMLQIPTNEVLDGRAEQGLSRVKVTCCEHRHGL